MPEILLRNPEPTIEELTRAGKAYFDQTYGETAESTQALVTAIYPDLGMSLVIVWFVYQVSEQDSTSLVWHMGMGMGSWERRRAWRRRLR